MAVHPVPLKLYRMDLPWVSHATHLGHQLHQDGSVFARPSEVLQLVSIYSAQLYVSTVA